MSDPTKTFSLGNAQIAQCVWNCVQTTSVNQDHTVYNPPPPSNQGTSSTPAAGGHVDLDFSVNISAATVTYTLTHEPFIVPTDKVWDGIQNMINGCIKQCSSS
jgi:hypothetical protein